MCVLKQSKFTVYIINFKQSNTLNESLLPANQPQLPRSFTRSLTNLPIKRYASPLAEYAQQGFQRSAIGGVCHVRCTSATVVGHDTPCQTDTRPKRLVHINASHKKEQSIGFHHH